MRYKIRNELKKTDYARLTKFLDEYKNVPIELFPNMVFELISIGPLFVISKYFGYSIKGEIWFQRPIGLDVLDDLMIDDEMSRSIVVNFDNIKLSKVTAEMGELESDLNKFLKTLERIVNHACIILDKQIDQTFTLNSSWLDRQLDVALEKGEIEKRGEIPRPFGTIHAKSSKEAKIRAGDLIPLYKEHNKTYLYDAKRVYFLLPHDFVANLLRCDEATMIMEEEFDKRGREVLRDLVYKKRLRKHETLGRTVCYYGLDEKTRRHLMKYLGHKKSRF